MRSPCLLLSLGLFLMILGIFLPFMMVIQLFESTFFLNFLSWGASVTGLVLGMVAVALMTSQRK